VLNDSALFWLGILGWSATVIGAIGARVLDDFSRHELKQYSQHHGRAEFFQRVLARHDSASLAAETLLSVGILLLLVVNGGWLLDSPSLVSVVALLMAVLATVVWIPRAVVRVWSAQLIYHTWYLWVVITVAMWPLTFGVHIAETLVHRLAGRANLPKDEEEAFEEEIRAIVTAGLQDGLLEADTREMIESVIELGDADVHDIMTPRSEVDALEVSLGWQDIFPFVTRCKRTRIPVYERTLDEVVGILYVKDLLPHFTESGHSENEQLRQLLRPAWHVPQTKPVDELLREFQSTRNHMAIVVDEYQAMAGVVTIEDALEEIVGEIRDEHEAEDELECVIVDDGTVEVLGRAHLDDLNEQLAFKLPEPDECDTVGGLVIQQLGYIPAVQEQLVIDGLCFTVLEASARRIHRLRIQHRDHNHGASKEAS
jgi:CBS domain containing-hemolysin-like protein